MNRIFRGRLAEKKRKNGQRMEYGSCRRYSFEGSSFRFKNKEDGKVNGKEPVLVAVMVLPMFKSKAKRNKRLEEWMRHYRSKKEVPRWAKE